MPPMKRSAGATRSSTGASVGAQPPHVHVDEAPDALVDAHGPDGHLDVLLERVGQIGAEAELRVAELARVLMPPRKVGSPPWA